MEAVRTAVRPPAVAGMFYPADPHVLAARVDAMLAAVKVPAEDVRAPAYVVPHAGYRYSGSTAAHVYARLRVHASTVSRVVVLGPAHHELLDGFAVSGARTWRTPLGELPVDRSAEGYLVVDEQPHALEHSIEVQLPFLQRAVGEVPFLPIVVGAADVNQVAALIEDAVAADRTGTVVVCSTDLSHYLPEKQAREQDQRTLQDVLNQKPERIGVRDACGVFALRGLVGWARSAGLRSRLLHYSTSADSSGDPTDTVGYPALGFS